MGLINSVAQQFTPEKQAQAKKAWQLGRNLIYKDNVFDSIMSTVQQNPAQGLAQAIVMVLKKIDEGMGRMPYDVALATGLMLLNDLVDAISQTGRVKFEPAMIEEALSQGIQLYLQSYGDQNDKAQLQQTMQMISGAAA